MKILSYIYRKLEQRERRRIKPAAEMDILAEVSKPSRLGRVNLRRVKNSYVLEAKRRVSKRVIGDLLSCYGNQVVLKGEKKSALRSCLA